MRKWLNKYFDLTKREFNGLLVLMVLIILLLGLPYVYKIVCPVEIDEINEQIAVKKLSSLLADKHTEKYSTHENVRHPKSKEVLFKFDPNTIMERDWQKLGLSLKQTQTILKYRRKGGRFREVEDLKKMYTISPQMYLRLAPYVEIKNTERDELYSYDKTNSHPLRVHKIPVVEINGADTLQLWGIRGIGPVFARRIVKYRGRLGGFYKKEQLLEVFGLDSVKYEEIKDQISIDSALVNKININTASFEDLKNHPYLSYKQINVIIAYREQHGDYADSSGLKKVAVLSPEAIERIIPYISFNNY